MPAIPEIKEPMPKDAKAETYHPPPQGEWTYADYLRLPDSDLRYEIIEGEISMSPSPIPRHQLILRNLIRILDPFIEEQNLGTLWVSPVDVIFPGEATILQPDLLFIARGREDIVTETNINGIPDLIIEIISPGSIKRDRRDKFSVYMQTGVREYWIVDPEQKTVDIHVIRGETYVPLGNFRGDDEVHSETLEGLSFTVKALF